MRPLRCAAPGQAMVEFALVLPLLLLLTFGTIELGLAVQRRLVLTGTAFVAARVAAVHGETADAGVRKVVETYAADAGSTWLTGVKPELDRAGSGMRVRMTRKDEGFTPALVGAMVASGGKPPQRGSWTVAAVVRPEFVPGRLLRGAAQVPTDLQVDYRVTLPGLERLKGIGDIVRKLPGGASGAELALAADPTTQATLANPMDRNGTVSPSKRYVSPENEAQAFRQAQRLAEGFDQLDKVVKAFYTAYVVAATVPGSTGVDATLGTLAAAFAQVDRTVSLAGTAERLDKAQKAFFRGGTP
jgi:hypothetical protein